MIRAVIFDVDGTLVDSVDQHARAWQDAFAEFGHDIAFDAIRAQIGKGGDQLMPVFLDPADIAARGEALQNRRAAILKTTYLPTITAFPMCARCSNVCAPTASAWHSPPRRKTTN